MATTPFRPLASSEASLAYAVESGIPIAIHKKGKSKYPFVSMNVGDSFAFPGEDIERVRQNAYSFMRAHAPMKFSVSSKHLRCWRVA